MKVTQKKHLNNGSGFCVDKPGSLLGNFLDAMSGRNLVASTSPNKDRVTVVSKDGGVIDRAYEVAQAFEDFSNTKSEDE